MIAVASTHYSAVEKRRGGRPRKEEIVVRQFTPHTNKNIKPENELMYAREAINTAKALYKRYNSDYPNPLNIEQKRLSEEARACWEYIYSQRNYEDIPERKLDGTIYNADEVVFAFECYTRWVKGQNFVKAFERPDGEMGIMPLIPNQSNFAEWLGVSSQMISGQMSSSEPARNSYKHILADCLSEGAMAGVYQPASTIFTLKNMCDWADKYEDRSVNKADDLGVAEAESLMKQLGYSRTRATLSPPLIEGDVDG